MDNLFLMRDVLDVCKVCDQNVRLLSLDQEKAFDRIDHSFFVFCLKSFWREIYCLDKSPL